MKKVLSYLKSKEFIISVLIILGFVLWNCIDAKRMGLIGPFNDKFGFWYDTLFSGHGEYLVIMLIFIFGFTSSKRLYQELTSSVLKNSIIRTDYKKYIKKRIITAYLKAVSPLYLVSIGLLIYGAIRYPGPLVVGDYSYGLMLMRGVITNPYIYVIITHIDWLLYASAVVNIVFIFIYLTKKLYVSLIASFLFVIFFDIFTQLLTVIIPDILGSETLKSALRGYNLYSCISSDIDILWSFIPAILFFILTSIIFYFVYKNKERTVLNFENIEN